MTKPFDTEIEVTNDVVALMVWQDISSSAPQPTTVVVTRESWERNHRLVTMDGFTRTDGPTRTYRFESPVDERGRRTIFHFQKVVGWAANVHTEDPA